MTRYPHLPQALHRLLLAGPVECTPAELYARLEAHRADPWPNNPVALSLWLKHHAAGFGIRVESYHTGEHRMLRLERTANGLRALAESPNNEPFFAFSTWTDLEAALLGLDFEAEELATLALALPGLRIARTIPAHHLHRVVQEWAAQYPQALEVRLYRGVVEVATVWPLG